MIECTFEDKGKSSLRHAVVDNVVINKKEEVLLVKRNEGFLEAGKWALPGGFVDRDERLAEAAQREVMEETGYETARPKLFRIIDRPDRPREDRQNIAFVYILEALEKTGEPDNETREQRWFSLSELPPDEEMAFDHLSDIQLYKEYLEKKFSLPKLG